MEGSWPYVIFSGGFAGGATFLGMYLILSRRNWARRNSASLVSFSAGVLLGVGFLHVIPEAMELTPHAPIVVLASFVLFYFLEHLLLIHAGHEQWHHNMEATHGEEDGCEKPHPLGVIAFVGMAMHSSIDGLIIGTGFEVGHEMGILATLAVVAHEVPEGIAMLSILLHYGHTRKTAVSFTSIVAIATPLAAILTFALVRHISPGMLGILMSMAAGSFIYIAASDLIPESHRSRGAAGTLSLIGGILVAMAAGTLAH